MTNAEIIVKLNSIAAKYGYGQGAEPFTDDEWNAIGFAKEIINDYARLTAEVRKQAVKDFAERVKMAFYYEFDELIPSIMADRIDELAKEVCGE